MSGYRITLVWEEIPESTKIYLLKGLDFDTFERICSCHGRYVNCDNQNEDVVWLSEWLEKQEAVEVKVGVPIAYNGRTDAVVVSGFIL